MIPAGTSAEARSSNRAPQDQAELQAILKSLPLDAWMTVETTPLTPHPERPGDDSLMSRSS
jgi:muconolactone delta-isomerase